MKETFQAEPVEVFSGNIIECGYVKSLLEAHGIQAFIRDEYVGTISPWVVSPGGVGSVKLQVARNDAVQATELIKSISFNEPETGEL
jgi:hypothetical protein